MSATRTITADPPTRADGILARLGRSMATHTRLVVGVWLIALIALGAAAPSVFTSLAGAGWQANGSESVQVRELAEQHFGGNSSAAVAGGRSLGFSTPHGSVDAANPGRGN